jgi:hypothetical protein
MRVSRLSFPINSPERRVSDKRVYLDMVDGALHIVTTEGSVPVGDVPVTYSSDELTDATLAGIAMFTAVDAEAQRDLISAAPRYLNIINDDSAAYTFMPADHGSYIRKDDDDGAPSAIVLTEEDDQDPTYVDGTFFTLRNVGEEDVTISGSESEPDLVVINGGAGLQPGDEAKLVRVAVNEWDMTLIPSVGGGEE